MKHKKLIALLAASVMAMTSMTALAADGDIVGDVNYVDKVKYKVMLPTTDGMSFTLDPQGLVTLDNGTYNEDEAGKIVSEGVMLAKNWSSVDVTLEATFTLTDSKTSGGVTLVGKDGTIDDTATQMQLIITDDIEDSESNEDLYISSEASTNKLTYTMPASQYEFTGNSTDGFDYTLAADATASTVTMTIGGSVATEADWSAYTGDDPETLTLNAVFEFKGADSTVLSGDSIIEADPDLPDAPDAEPVGPDTDDFVMVASEDGSVSYTFVDAPEGTLTVFKVDGTAKTKPVENGYVAYSEGVLSVDADRAALFFTESKTYNLVATIGSTDYELTYTKE